MSLNELLKEELKKQENDKKTISVVLEAAKVDELDNIVRGFNKINSEKTFTRQKLIEIAITNLIQESNLILEENEFLDLNDVDDIEEEVYDTVIFAAQYEGFKEAFLGEKKWYYVRLGKERIEKIKYVACYVGHPISAITHYAKVKAIEEVIVDEKKKYVIYFDGEPIKLDREIPMGDVPSMAVRSNRYVCLEDLVRAESYEDFLKE